MRCRQPLADLFDHPRGDVLRCRSKRDDDMLQRVVREKVEHLHVVRVTEERMVDALDDGLDNLLEIEIVEHHSVLVDRSFELDAHPVRVTVNVLTASGVEREPMSHLPMEFLRDPYRTFLLRHCAPPCCRSTLASRCSSFRRARQLLLSEARHVW